MPLILSRAERNKKIGEMSANVSKALQRWDQNVGDTADLTCEREMRVEAMRRLSLNLGNVKTDRRHTNAPMALKRRSQRVLIARQVPGHSEADTVCSLVPMSESDKQSENQSNGAISLNEFDGSSDGHQAKQIGISDICDCLTAAVTSREWPLAG